jgi:hypothetical protein
MVSLMDSWRRSRVSEYEYAAVAGSFEIYLNLLENALGFSGCLQLCPNSLEEVIIAN